MFYSQTGQDRFLEENVFHGFKNGFFFDVGAHDGIDINNTLYFEKNHGWTGVNIDANKKVYDNLVKNRPTCTNIYCAVCNEDGESEFYLNTGYTEMISGLKSTFDDRHYQRLQRELKQFGGHTEITKVPTKRIETICDELNIKRIHYMSIDVEGAEFEVLKSINFDKVFIDVIGFENNYRDQAGPIIGYLYSKGYLLIFYSDDIFMIHRESQFFKASMVKG
jgi:FkbM family methyltransferase